MRIAVMVISLGLVLVVGCPNIYAWGVTRMIEPLLQESE